MLFSRWYLWVAPNLLLGLCLVGLLRKGRYRRLPWFLAYTAFQLIRFVVGLTLALLILRSSTFLTLYRWTLVFGDGISTALELAVIYELANELLVSRLSLLPVIRFVLRWTIALLILFVGVASALLPQIDIEKVTKYFQILNLSASIVELGLLIALLLFTRVLHISWRSLPAGIALGLGISASAELSGAALLSVLGRTGYISIDFIRMGAFHICVVIWLVYIFLPERLPRFTGTGLQKPDLELWDQELHRMVR